MKNIVLIGMPGCGKTTVAKELASLLQGVVCVDIDEEIVKAQNRTINDIFEKDGENFFRELETQMLTKYTGTDNFIISTGGGVVERDENIDLLKETGLIFYLYADIDVLMKRLKKDSSRPLLKGHNLKMKLNILFARRDYKFRQADFIIDTGKMSPKEIAVKITEEINYGGN